MALPHGAVGWSAVCDCGIPDHTHLLFYIIVFVVELLIIAVEVYQQLFNHQSQFILACSSNPTFLRHITMVNYCKFISREFYFRRKMKSLRNGKITVRHSNGIPDFLKKNDFESIRGQKKQGKLPSRQILKSSRNPDETIHSSASH